MIPPSLIGEIPQDQLEKLYAPPKMSPPAQSYSKPDCLVTVLMADGRTVNLGKAGTFIFKIRRFMYLWNRHKEFKGETSWQT